MPKYSFHWVWLIVLASSACSGKIAPPSSKQLGDPSPEGVSSASDLADGDRTDDGGPGGPGTDQPPGTTADAGKPLGTDDDAGDATRGENDSGKGGPASQCASTFGRELTDGFGRLDGTVRAIVSPDVFECRYPNDDHVTLQVDVRGQTYRMVINVESNRRQQDRRVHFLSKEAPLPAPAFEEGWHLGLALDYQTDLSTKSDEFRPKTLKELSAILESIPIGAPVAVYATNDGRRDSAHLVHRNGGYRRDDGAVVLRPDSASPEWFLFRFSQQQF